MPDPEETVVEPATVSEPVSESPAEPVEATPAEPGTTADTPAPGPQEETFFDPTDLSPELKLGWKQLQGSYTKRMQALSKEQAKLDEYDRFKANPVESIKQLAGQYGLSVSAAAAAVAEQQAPQEFDPQDWGDVTKHITDSVIQQLQPYINQQNTQTQSNIERDLDDALPEWRDYEPQMNQMLTKHPTLSSDPVALAKMVIPENVREGKAMAAAMRKLEAKAAASSVTQGTQTPKGIDITKPPKSAQFSDYVDWARKKIAREAANA